MCVSDAVCVISTEDSRLFLCATSSLLLRTTFLLRAGQARGQRGQDLVPNCAECVFVDAYKENCWQTVCRRSKGAFLCLAAAAQQHAVAAPEGAGHDACHTAVSPSQPQSRQAFPVRLRVYLSIGLGSSPRSVSSSSSFEGPRTARPRTYTTTQTGRTS